MLQPGLYEQVINNALSNELSEIPEARKSTAPIDAAEASKVLAQYLTDVVQKGLENVQDNGGGIEAQIQLANQIVNTIQNTTQEADFASLGVDQRAEQLLALLRDNDPRLATGKSAKELERPETSIAQSSLFTGAIHEPQMYTELKKEIVSADRIDMLVSFIKWSGLRLIMDELRQFTQSGGELRIITTSYIDEYDVPVAKANNNGYYNEMLDVMKGLMQALKDNQALRFAVVTGCLKIAKESIFTGTNNFVSDTTTNLRLNEYFGFVQSEVDQLLKDADLTEQAENIKKWYDGYHFGDFDVYCPWDVMNYMLELQRNPKAKPISYWKNTSDNAIIRSFIDYAGSTITNKLETLMAGGCIVQRVDENLTYNYLHIRDTAKVLIILSISFLLVAAEDALTTAITFSALIAIMFIGIGLQKKRAVVAKRLSVKYGKLWVAAEVFLFVLVVATVNIGYLGKVGAKALLLIAGALVFRMLGVFVCLLGTSLSKKERLFAMMAYTPKATVQAAIGGIPLALGFACGDTVLTVAVLAIVLTAPLGAFAMDLSYKRLLKKE